MEEDSRPMKTAHLKAVSVNAADIPYQPASLDIWDKKSRLQAKDNSVVAVTCAGGRRGAQMGSFDVGHPDVVDFVRAKRENGRLRQFNLSLLITQDFMEAVKN